ncbi:MAG: hypothetical protein AAGU23_05535 [Bacillota bacterium]
MENYVYGIFFLTADKGTFTRNEERSEEQLNTGRRRLIYFERYNDHGPAR